MHPFRPVGVFKGIIANTSIVLEMGISQILKEYKQLYEVQLFVSLV